MPRLDDIGSQAGSVKSEMFGMQRQQQPSMGQMVPSPAVPGALGMNQPGMNMGSHGM